MTLSVTATHPFYSESREWVHASKLNIGERLVEDDGGTLTVTAVDFDPNAPINLTYNLTVADYHTYFVGEDGVLVHNGRDRRIIGEIIIAGLSLFGQDPVENAVKFDPKRGPRPEIQQELGGKSCPIGSSGGSGPDPFKKPYRIKTILVKFVYNKK